MNWPFSKKEAGRPETAVAQELGISHEDLAALRKEHLFQGEHFKKDGRDLVILPAGVEALQGILKKRREEEGPGDSDAADDEPDAETKDLEGDQKWAPVAVELTVTRLVMNPQLVLAKNEAGALIRVRVRSSKNFLPGMKLKAKQERPEVADIYVLEGRCPRFRGKW